MLLSVSPPASGVPLEQQAYVKASNTGRDDWFGGSVAIDLDTMVVGAPLEDSSYHGVDPKKDDDQTRDAGAVYIYTRTDGVWTQQAQIKASNPGVGDQFGYSVALSGDTLIVGAPGERSNATGINGNQADNSLSDAGAVYVFNRTGTRWSQQAYIKASNPDSGDKFGYSVAYDGKLLAVGAPYEDNGSAIINGDQTANNAVSAGAAYAFRRSGTGWSQSAYLKASNAQQQDYFGYSVGVFNDVVVVGAPGEDSTSKGINGSQTNDLNVTDRYGAVYAFRGEGSVWRQESYIKSSIPDPLGAFGSSLSFSATTMVVGAPGNTRNTGNAFVFVRNQTNWRDEAVLRASNPGFTDYFGKSVAISGDAIIVGAHQEGSKATGINGAQGDNSALASGAAYVFIRARTLWKQQAYLKASNTDTTGRGGQLSSDSSPTSDFFGEAVAIDGSTAVVGAKAEDSAATGINGDQSDESAIAAGAAYVFTGFGPASDIALTYEVINSPVLAGGEARTIFRLNATNIGVSNATDIRIRQTLSAEVEASADPSSGTYADNVWSLNLATGRTATLSFSLRIPHQATAIRDLMVSSVLDAVVPADSNPSNNSTALEIPVVSVPRTEVTITSTPAVNNQSGLLVSTVTITNNNSGPIPAFRLRVRDLPAGTKVYNAHNSDVPGEIPYLLYNQELAAGASVTLTVEFHRPSLDANFSPQYSVELLESPLTLPTGGGIIIQASRVQALANGDMLIETASIPGTTYAVEYSHDLQEWTRVSGSVTAAGNRLQWIDSGPPKTESHPSTVQSRMYRFIQLPASN